MSAFIAGVFRTAPGANFGAPNLTPNYIGVSARRVVDMVDGGQGRIAGSVKVDGLLAARRVRLLETKNCRIIRETFSAANGAYEFQYIDATREYLVLAQDDFYRLHDSELHDFIVPVPMP